MSIVKKTSDILYKFSTTLVDNRIFDLYLKYNGIKLLTTATLVPIALILGKKIFEDLVLSQKGGVLEESYPVIDDPLIGEYLKLTGVVGLSSLTPNTLVPLGVLMYLYSIYNRSQKGGGVKDYIKDIWGNRILDIFMKYRGIKLLTTSTLVPIGLLLGKDYLESILINEQKGGGDLELPDDLLVLDDPLLGNYLKLMGIGSLSLTANTLIPLGLLSLIYFIYLDEN